MMEHNEIRCPECGVAILEHPASRCLDAWVATKVMGWQKSDPDYERTFWRDKRGVWTYFVDAFLPSSDISAAMEVLEKIRNQIDCIDIYSDDYGIMYWNKNLEAWDTLRSDTIPLAISRASILAKEAE